MPFKFTRRAPGPKDISIQIAKAGICHSDYHQVFNEWQGSTYPMVPGCESQKELQSPVQTPSLLCNVTTSNLPLACPNIINI